MKIGYDALKAAANFRKHGVRLADAEGVFGDPFAIHLEDPDAEGEQRFIGVGLSSAGSVLVVAYAYRGNELRVISARRASRKERRTYEEGIRLL